MQACLLVFFIMRKRWSSNWCAFYWSYWAILNNRTQHIIAVVVRLKFAWFNWFAVSKYEGWHGLHVLLQRRHYHWLTRSQMRGTIMGISLEFCSSTDILLPSTSRQLVARLLESPCHLRPCNLRDAEYHLVVKCRWFTIRSSIFSVFVNGSNLGLWFPNPLRF